MTTEAPVLESFDIFPAVVRQRRQALFRKARVAFDAGLMRIRVWTSDARSVQMLADYEVIGGSVDAVSRKGPSSVLVEIGSPIGETWQITRTGRPCNCPGTRRLAILDPWKDPD